MPDLTFHPGDPEEARNQAKDQLLRQLEEKTKRDMETALVQGKIDKSREYFLKPGENPVSFGKEDFERAKFKTGR